MQNQICESAPYVFVSTPAISLFAFKWKLAIRHVLYILKKTQSTEISIPIWKLTVCPAGNRGRGPDSTGGSSKSPRRIRSWCTSLLRLKSLWPNPSIIKLWVSLMITGPNWKKKLVSIFQIWSTQKMTGAENPPHSNFRRLVLGWLAGW